MMNTLYTLTHFILIIVHQLSAIHIPLFIGGEPEVK